MSTGGSSDPLWDVKVFVGRTYLDFPHSPRIWATCFSVWMRSRSRSRSRRSQHIFPEAGAAGGWSTVVCI